MANHSVLQSAAADALHAAPFAIAPVAGRPALLNRGVRRMAGRSRRSPVPDAQAWRGYEDDLDVRHLHRLFFGKTIHEVQQYFGEGRSIERMDELLFAPRPVFQYYVHAFAEFLRSDEAKGDPDSAGPFLTLLEAREKRDPGSVCKIYDSLKGILAFLRDRQEYFDADVSIYGNLRDRVDDIARLCDCARE